MHLVLKDNDEPVVPLTVLRFADDKDAYRKSYAGGRYVTDNIKKALLSSLNEQLFPLPPDGSGDWHYREAYRQGVIAALRNTINLLP